MLAFFIYAVADPGGDRGGRPPLSLDQIEAEGLKKSFETAPRCLRVWMTAPPFLSEGLDPPLICETLHDLDSSLST